MMEQELLMKREKEDKKKEQNELTNDLKQRFSSVGRSWEQGPSTKNESNIARLETARRLAQEERKKDSQVTVSAEDLQYKMAIVVNTDLKMSKGKMAAQVGHACVGCTLEARNKDIGGFTSWFDEGQRKVVLKASLHDIKRLYNTLKSEGMIHYLVRDFGLTEIPSGSITCIGVGPALASEVDKYTKKFKLM